MFPKRRSDFWPSPFEDDCRGSPPPTPNDDFKDILGITLTYPVRSKLNVREMTYVSSRYLMPTVLEATVWISIETMQVRRWTNLTIYLQTGRGWKCIPAPMLNDRKDLLDLNSKETATQQ